MKKFYQFYLAMILIGFSTLGVKAQLTCKESITVAVNEFTGTAEIFVESMVTSAIPAGTEISQSTFNCSDVGSVVTVTATSGDESCETAVEVVDVSPPVAIVDSDVTISYFLEPIISVSDINDGSYDICGEVTMEVNPAYYTADMVGEVVDVTLSVTDMSGNVNEAIASVFIEGQISELPVKCRDGFTIRTSDPYEVTNYIVHDSPNKFEYLELEMTDAEGQDIADNVISSTHFGTLVTAKLIKDYNQSTCHTTILIEESDCNPLQFCDVKCNEDEGMSCSEGHSDTDNVEWPCKLTIDGAVETIEDLRPEKLVELYGISEPNSEPQFILNDCHNVAVSYADDVFEFMDGNKIIRQWIVLDWNTGKDYEYYQEIDITNGIGGVEWNICDTEPNSSPVGDCSSGHSLEDDVEWPSDTVAIDHRILPNELMLISGVSKNNVRPVIKNESRYIVDYEDEVVAETESQVVLRRRWIVKSQFVNSLRAEYEQIIHIMKDSDILDKVYVTTFTGRPMPGVSVNSELTNTAGVAEVSGNEEIELLYEDDPYEGIDLLDLLLLRKFILGEITFPDTTYPGMDLSGDGNISTLDFVFLQKAILKIDDENLGWRFHKRENPLVNVKGDFIAYKMGDINDSAMLQEGVDEGPKAGIEVVDLLLNAGELYEISITLTTEMDFQAAEIVLDAEKESIEVLEVTSALQEIQEEDTYHHTDSEGETRIIIERRTATAVTAGDELFTMKILAKNNTTLAEALGLSEEGGSFLVDADLEKTYLTLDVQNTITSGLRDPQLSRNVSIFPNPASDYIKVETRENMKYSFLIQNTQGGIVKRTGERKIDVSQLPKGIYTIIGLNKNEQLTGRFIKL